MNEKQQRCRTMTETGGGRGGCRAVEAAGDFSRNGNNREKGKSQTVITRQHEIQSNTLQGGNSERNERNQRQKKKERNRKYTNRTDDSPQPTNTARVQLPHSDRLASGEKKIHHGPLNRDFFSTSGRHIDQSVIRVKSCVRGKSPTCRTSNPPRSRYAAAKTS